jgi:hypothetical protein
MKILLLAIFSLMTLKVMAPDMNQVFILREEPIDAYDRLYKAVFQVECKGNIRAYNLLEEATGPLQIRPIRLLDYNQRTGSNYVLEDCYDIEVSKKIFMY